MGFFSTATKRLMNHSDQKIVSVGTAGAGAVRPRRGLRVLLTAALLFCLFLLLPLGLSIAAYFLDDSAPRHWSQARRDSTSQAPDPATTPEAVIQVYAARAFSWRGAFGTHTWIAAKPSGAPSYTRFEVIGWYVRRGQRAVRIQPGIADGYWFGSRPELIAELRGDGVDQIIDKLRAAAERYPHMHEYGLWPGPNSNTFIAYLGREVPALKLDLPPTAIGKDYIAGGDWVARSPSGTGFQFSLYGLAGFLIGVEEGLELNLFGLTAGIDFKQPAIKLPGLGRLGVRQIPSE